MFDWLISSLFMGFLPKWRPKIQSFLLPIFPFLLTVCIYVIYSTNTSSFIILTSLLVSSFPHKKKKFPIKTSSFANFGNPEDRYGKYWNGWREKKYFWQKKLKEKKAEKIEIKLGVKTCMRPYSCWIRENNIITGLVEYGMSQSEIENALGYNDLLVSKLIVTVGTQAHLWVVGIAIGSFEVLSWFFSRWR